MKVTKTNLLIVFITLDKSTFRQIFAVHILRTLRYKAEEGLCHGITSETLGLSAWRELHS